MQYPSLTVRSGVSTDLPAVFALVQQLAEYERAPAAVVTSLQDYRDALQRKLFELLVAEDVSGVIGMMLYYPAWSTWKGKMLYLEDFVVAEHARRRDVGRQLWMALVQLARSQDYTGLRWQVLDWNEPAKAFYRKVGADIEGGWENGRLWL